MGIVIESHTLLRAEERGATEAEIQDVLQSGVSIPAKYGKMGKGKIYAFNDTRHGKFYKQKRVEVFYLVEDGDLITVTVYVFFGTWESV